MPVDPNIIKVIQGLLAKTVGNGCTVEEAASAAAKAKAILARHELSMADVATEATPDDVQLHHLMVGEPRRGAWELVVSGIAEGCDCIGVTRRDRERWRVSLIGLHLDTLFAAALIETLLPMGRREADRQGRRERFRGSKLVAFRNTFLAAYGVAIGDRLRARIFSDESEHQRYALIVASKAERVERKVEQLGANGPKRRARIAPIEEAVIGGLEFGREVPLETNRIAGGPSAGQLLLT